MADGTITVVGLPAFVKYLKSVESELPKQIRRVNLEVTQAMAMQVAQAAPVGTEAERDPHPGKLRASVKARATAYSGRVEVGKGIVYSKPVIFGWRKHNIPSNRFPYTVLWANKGLIEARYHAALAAALRAEATAP
jgi:hypothetical protein